MSQGMITRQKATEALYDAAREYVAAVNDADTDVVEDYRLCRVLDRRCERWAKLHGYTGEPTGRLREAAMNGWPLPEVE